jgi:mannose-6-phosphate isomerase
MDGFVRLIEQKYFAVDRFEIAAGGKIEVSFAAPGCLVGLSGSGSVMAAGGSVELIRGQAVVVPAGNGSVIVGTGSGASFVRCLAPVE